MNRDVLSTRSCEQIAQEKTIRVGDKRMGINACGYFRTESGVGAAARSYVRALRHMPISVALRDLSSVSGNRAEDRTLAMEDESDWYDVNLICVDVDLHYAALSYLGEDFFNDRYNIGVWWWELPRFPDKWYDRFAYYDEIWVGTSFVANTLAPVSPVPVVRIPPVLTAARSGSRDRGRFRLEIHPEEYVYLFVFDFHSHVQRKNPLAVIQAFKQAFAPSEPVRLVLKCVNAGSDPEGLATMMAQAQGFPISIYDGYWTPEEILDLTAACDVYISLHRSEGAGLTIADAMALAKPVIATGWSGNMDFMDVSNSFPVRYEFVELNENIGPYRAGEKWAEPSVEHAAELMRFVYEDREEAHRRGQAALRSITTNYSVEAVARLIRQRLEAIAVRQRFSTFRQEVQVSYHRYRQLPERLRVIVREAVPSDALVLVVSKGDEELVKFDGGIGWHFPQNEAGEYAGYYPANSEEAIAHLDALRSKGATFLLFPNTAFWWLEHYAAFKQHLDSYRPVWCDECCMIYDLSAYAADRNQLGEKRAETVVSRMEVPNAGQQ